MTATVDPAALAAWHAAAFGETQLAAGLTCEVADVRLVLSLLGEDAAAPAGLTPRRRVGLAIAIALNGEAGIALPAAAAAARECRRVCDSVLANVDFVPPDQCEGTPPAGEHDPFALFVPYASEPVAIPAINEFLDVLDGGRVRWRRPRRDAYRLACELHRVLQALQRAETPALQEAYIELLRGLREPADHVCEWLGTIAGGGFLPAPGQSANLVPEIRHDPGIGGDPPGFADTGETRTSVNVSLVARSFKRRMLGLQVARPAGSRPE